MDQVKTFAPGEVLCREGEMGRDAFLIQSGRVRVTRRQGDVDVPLAELGPSEFVGEFSIIDHAPRSATVTAIVATKVVAIASGRMSVLFERSPEIAATIVKLLIHKLRAANQRQAGSGASKDWMFWRRTLYILLLLVSIGDDDEADEFELPEQDTLQNLAIGLGISPEETVKVVERMLEAGVLGRSQDQDGESALSLNMDDLNMLFNYIQHTFTPGSVEPAACLGDNEREVATHLLSLCRRHYGDLSSALSTFRRGVLIDFIAGSSAFEGNSVDMRKRLIGQALDQLQEQGYLHALDEDDADVVTLDLEGLDVRVDEDLCLQYCRERYAILSKPAQPQPPLPAE